MQTDSDSFPQASSSNQPHGQAPSDCAMALFRGTDWSQTDMGPVEDWPQSLRTAVDLVLHSGHPMYVAWGPDLNLLFNDSYLSILGARGADPGAVFGRPYREVWYEVWDQSRPMFEQVLAGQPVWHENHPFTSQRNGFTERTFITFSCSPLRDDAGRIGGVFCLCMETTETVHMVEQRALAIEELMGIAKKLQIATDAAEMGLFDENLQTGEISWSARTKAHFGLPTDSEITRDLIFAGFHPEDAERMQETLQRLYTTTTDGRYEEEFRTVGIADKRERWVAARGQVFYANDGTPLRLVGTTMDITERKRAERRARELSQHDTLTGLPNRALLFEYWTHLVARSNRTGEGGAVLFIDLDRFKPINDLYGHEVGDKVLQEVARRLLSCTRKEDIVSRLGGDEFIVVLPHIDTTHAPATVAQHILEAIRDPFMIGTNQLTVEPSIGISLFPSQASDLETLIRYADLAMYSAKKAGRNTFRLYTPGLDETAGKRLRLEQKLKKTMQADGMALFYQPIIEVKTRKIIGAEALIRMPVGKRKLVGPAEFIEIAESAGLINQLGEWVAAEACRQHQEWRAAGLPPLSIAINVSPHQFRERRFASRLAATVERSGIDPDCLQIEVTESAVMDNLAEAVATLNELRSMGIRISLDDFGTGYSSLSYLSTLPLDKLKIDQSFITCVSENPTSRAVTDAIIALGRSLNLKVVGEGIETEESMEYLRSRGCDQAQGYLFSRPLSATDFEAWYGSHLALSAQGKLFGEGRA